MAFYYLFRKGGFTAGAALNLRDHEVTTLYTEYCNLSGLDSLCAVYREVKGDIWPFVNLHKSVKSSGMNESNVIKLLTIANNDLPAVEDRYELLKRKEGELQGKVRNSTMIFQDLNNQISSMRSILDSIRLDIEKEKKRLHQLYQKRIKQESLVLQYEQLCRYIEIFSFFYFYFFFPIAAI